MNDLTHAPIRGPLGVSPDLFRPNPHAGFSTVRPVAPVIDLVGNLFVTRHDDVTALMTDPRTRQIETESLEMAGIRSGALHEFFANSMLVSNPPVHAKRRGPAARTFAFKLVQAWRPHIRKLVEELIDAHYEKGEMDFLDTIASPLPARLIATILGAPEEDAPEFAAKVYMMTRGIGAFRAEQFPEIEKAAKELTDYVRELLNKRRADPRDDFLSDYVRNVEESGDLSETEMLIQVVTLIIGGSDTTRFGMTAMLSELLQRRDQWQALCADPALVPSAVREALRYEPSVGTIGRVVVEPLEIGGIAFEPGTVLQASILSAQRDEAVFADPQSFDIRRDDHPRWSVTFGGGAHRCLGEALARAEMEEALAVICERLPELELVGAPPATKGHIGIRGIEPMRVGWPVN
jgi:cytochrome P450